MLVSGPPCCYGTYESERAIDFAVRHGYRGTGSLLCPYGNIDTGGGAVILPELARRAFDGSCGYQRLSLGARGTVYRRLAPPESSTCHGRRSRFQRRRLVA